MATVNDKKHDLVIVRQIQQGRIDLFDVLVEKYQGRIEQLCSHFVGDRSESKDVAQETFIRAYRGLNEFKGDSSFYTWLYRIAINTAKNYAKSRQQQNLRCQDSLEAHQEYMREKPLIEEQYTPEHEVASEEFEAELYAHIQDLPAELKSTLLLREMQGLSYEEIADILETPVGTIRSRLHRARCLVYHGLGRQMPSEERRK